MNTFGRLVAVGALTAGFALPLGAQVAFADTPPGSGIPCCTPTKPPADVAGTQIQRTPTVDVAGTSQSLPFTGADVVELSLIGVGAVGFGTVLVRRSRRSATA